MHTCRIKGRRTRGFTVLEAFISSVLFFLAISVAVMAFMAGSRHFTGNQATIQACHDCYTILQSIACEVREAMTIVSYSTTSITLDKYHKPTGKMMQVTWTRNGDRVARTCQISGSSTQTTFFGDNVTDLSFGRSMGSITSSPLGVALNPAYQRQVITITLQIRNQSTKSIVSLSERAFMRAGQPVVITIEFN